MMTHPRLLLFLTGFLLFIVPDGVWAQLLSQKITEGWQFRQQGTQDWLPAQVPGEIFTDLLRHGRIPDPYYRDNEKKVQWVAEANWEYQTQFKPGSETIKKQHLELVFDGLDTYADVYLNGKLLFIADNMFRQWRIDVKDKLDPQSNTLFIRFYSAQKKVDSLAKADLPFVIPDHARAYARKAQFQFGWDWGPKLISAGIWHELRLEGYDSKPAEKPYVAPVKVQLVQQPDAQGTSFYFRINDKTVYMKGANYIPSEALLTRMNRAEYRKVLMRAKAANMNMIRVWGGGIYENDDFYDLCDSLGLYVWQDFMFAGAMIPGDDHFFNNVKEEVQYQVKRLRHHKSVVLWCGNNEIDEAWNRWGWQSSFHIPAADSVKLWQDYTRMFRDSIPKWVKEVDPYRPYISSSPQLGWGVKESIKQGDSHYWGVWWGLEDFEVFEEKTGRFVSEYGMQTMPGYQSILQFTEPADRYLFSDIINHHQKAGNGFDKINHYLSRYMIDSAKIMTLSLEDYSYLTQCVQYYGFKNMILIHRSKAPYNMGTLLWQLNDCWPVASWSITDYDKRRPRAAWYAVKKAYSDHLPERDRVKPKDLKLHDPKISYRIQGNYIYLKSAAFAKYVFLELPGYEGELSDNYFDLPPGKELAIRFTPQAWKNKDAALKIKSLWQVVKN